MSLNGNVPFVAPGEMPIDPIEEAPTLEVTGDDLLDGLDPEDVAYLATVPGTLAGSTRSSTATSA